MLIERIVVASIGTILLSGLTHCLYQSAKMERFEDVFLNTVLLINIISLIAFPICMIFC